MKNTTKPLEDTDSPLPVFLEGEIPDGLDLLSEIFVTKVNYEKPFIMRYTDTTEVLPSQNTENDI